MAKINTSEIKTGFWVAIGFFLFSLILGIVQFSVMYARKKAGESG